MSFSFSSLGHELATGLQDAYKGAQAVETFVAKVATSKNESTVEALTALLPSVGPQAVVVERAAFSIAGEVASILNDITGAGEKALLSAGFDATILSDFKSLISSVPGLLKGI